MPNKRNDLRIKYTKLVIKKALFELMLTQPLSRITVTDICNTAEINRGTFYKYYNDPKDLLIQIENHLIVEIQEVLDKTLGTGTYYESLLKALDYTAKSSELCKILFSNNGDPEFIQRILSLAHDKTIGVYQASAPKASKEKLELLYIFISNGIIGIMKNWINSDMAESPEELAELLSKLITQCISISA